MRNDESPETASLSSWVRSHHTLRLFEVAPLLMELLLLRVDLLLQALHEAPHLCELGFHVITAIAGAAHRTIPMCR